MLPTQSELLPLYGCLKLILKQGMEMHSWARTELWPSRFRCVLLQQGAAFKLIPPVLHAGTGSLLY